MCHLWHPQLVYIRAVIGVADMVAWLPRRVRRKIRGGKEWVTTLYYTLCYNYFTTFFIALEIVLEPAFWFVEKFARYLGPVSNIFILVLLNSRNNAFQALYSFLSIFPFIRYTCIKIYLFVFH